MTERPLKIGYIWQYEATGLSPVAATALHIQAVVRGLERRGHQVRTVVIRDGVPHYSDDLHTWQPIHSRAGTSAPFRLGERVLRGAQSRLRLPYFRLFDSYRFGRAAILALRGYDALYERFWLMNTGGLMTSESLSLPLVYEVNGDLVEEYAQLGIELPDSQWRVIYRLTRSMFARAARVVTVSPTLRERTISRWGLKPEQVVAVSNGAHVDLFAQAQPDLELSAQYGFSSAPVVMFVGSFKPWHGLDLLLTAFAQVAAQHPDAKLALVGDGPVRPDLEAQAERLGLKERILFTGAVSHPQVAALLQDAQIAVVNPRLSPASLSQSPLKLFEYMAAGKAIVAPAIPNVQAILQDGVEGRLVTPDSPEALAQVLLQLLQDADLRQRMGQAARQKALANYSWDRTVAQLEGIFYEELDKRKVQHRPASAPQTQQHL